MSKNKIVVRLDFFIRAQTLVRGRAERTPLENCFSEVVLEKDTRAQLAAYARLAAARGEGELAAALRSAQPSRA